MTKNHKYFTAKLLAWHKLINNRTMPWKGEKGPYKIWLSEIILQQTRVEQGLEYYNKFVKTHPTINSLAAANEKTVFKLWEGLGYYSRCRNLIATAKIISTDYNGKFPDKYEDILKLKGVGPYTAAAIAAFAYNLPHAVVDGNVMRVLARFFEIETPIDSAGGKKILTSLAYELLSKKNAAIYNQAIMDFGATVCKPQLPLCASCPLQKKCGAFLNNKVSILPIKEKAIKKTQRWFYYIVAQYKNEVYIQERLQKDIWQNLHQFVLIEMPEKSSVQSVINSNAFKTVFGSIKYDVAENSKEYTQILSHQTIRGNFLNITLPKKIKITGFNVIEKKHLKKLSFPKFINTYLQDKKYL